MTLCNPLTDDDAEPYPVTSARDGWHRVDCLWCDWYTTGLESVCEDAWHEHKTRTNPRRKDNPMTATLTTTAYSPTSYADAISEAIADAEAILGTIIVTRVECVAIVAPTGSLPSYKCTVESRTR